MLHKNLLLISLTALLFTSCSKDNDDIITGTPALFNYTVPATYTFDRSGATTIDYAGQTSRLLMLDEMEIYINAQATAGTVVNISKLTDMYANANNSFVNPVLNTSGKQLRDKTAASRDYFSLYLGGGSVTEQTNVRALFETQFTNANAASQGATASAGVAGVYLDGAKKRLFATNGLEPKEILIKGIMGACFLDQACNNYLSINKLDEGTNRDDNTNKILVSGKSYTAMEHNWDEAYGYIYGANNTVTNPEFWNSYINDVSDDADFSTLKTDIELAFRTGRAAIVANDYAVRDAQANIIKAKLAMVPAIKAVSYLQEAKTLLPTGDAGAKAFHDLSEGYGFIMSLRYTNQPGTNNPYFSKTEVDAMLASITSGPNGLWDIDNLSPKLNAISSQIATKFGFTVAQASN